MGNLFDRWIGNCLGCIDTQDPAWSSLKIIFKPIFDFKNDDAIDKLFTEWDLKLNDLDLKNSVSLEVLVNDLPLKYILLIIFGETFVKDNIATFDMLQNLAKEFLLKLAESETPFTSSAKELLIKLQPKDESLAFLWNTWVSEKNEAALIEAAELGLTVAQLTLGLRLAQFNEVNPVKLIKLESEQLDFTIYIYI